MNKEEFIGQFIALKLALAGGLSKIKPKELKRLANEAFELYEESQEHDHMEDL